VAQGWKLETLSAAFFGECIGRFQLCTDGGGIGEIDAGRPVVRDSSSSRKVDLNLIDEASRLFHPW
jgi:hypothetical protein